MPQGWTNQSDYFKSFYNPVDPGRYLDAGVVSAQATPTVASTYNPPTGRGIVYPPYSGAGYNWNNPNYKSAALSDIEGLIASEGP